LQKVTRDKKQDALVERREKRRRIKEKRRQRWRQDKSRGTREHEVKEGR